MWSDWISFFKHIHQPGMTKQAPHSAKYMWASTEPVESVNFMDVRHTSQVRILANPQDMVHAAMIAADLPILMERQEGTPLDVEPSLTPPGSENTPKILAPQSTLQGVRPSCWPDTVCMYPISDPHEDQLPVTLDLWDALGIDTGYYRQPARETEMEVISIRDTHPSLHTMDSTALLQTDLVPLGTNSTTDDMTQTEENWTTTSLATGSTQSSANEPSDADFIDIPNSLWLYANDQLKTSNTKLHSLLQKNCFIATLLNGRIPATRLLTIGEKNFVAHEVGKGIWPSEFLGINSVRELAAKLRAWYAHVHATAPDAL